MNSEQFQFGIQAEQASKETQSIGEIFVELVALQNKYFQATTDEERVGVESEQYTLIDQGKFIAGKHLKSGSDETLSEEDRDYAMGEYGHIMDQLAVCIPWTEVKNSTDQYMRDEALQNLLPYFDAHPKAREVAKWIFSLYHHGAGIDKALTADAWERELNGKSPKLEFAQKYIEAEEKGRVYLEKYLALEFGGDCFSLDSDYHELIAMDAEGMRVGFTFVRDVANWYGRIAEYQKAVGEKKKSEMNARRAIELQKKLIAHEPANDSYRQALDMIYRQQGMSQ